MGPHPQRTRAWAFFVCVVLVGTAAASGSSLRAQSRAESDAKSLEERLYAPCCRQQPLDGHESEPAHALRREIRERLRAGAAPSSVEAVLVERYGPSIVSIPAGRDPRGGITLVLTAGMALAAACLFALGLRWVRRSRLRSDEAAPTSLDPDAELDAKLDRALREHPP
jgi:cytochrome c-type biogenesis protein CcmH/NrfF